MVTVLVVASSSCWMTFCRVNGQANERPIAPIKRRAPQKATTNTGHLLERGFSGRSARPRSISTSADSARPDFIVPTSIEYCFSDAYPRLFGEKSEVRVLPFCQ